MVPKLYKAAEVCEIAQLQPYVLRSWEKEFPGIGLQKADDSGRLYRQSDLDHVLRIKQLVFGEGLTVSGARRRLEDAGPTPAARADEVIEALSADVRKRISNVRDGLRSLLQILNNGASGPIESVPAAKARPAARVVAKRGKAPARAAKTSASRSKSTGRSSSARARKRA